MSPPPAVWVEFAADTISIAGEPLAIVHQDTSNSSLDNIRVRITSLVALDILSFRFGFTVAGGQCISPLMRSESYTELGLGAGETREAGQPSLNPYHRARSGLASTAATNVTRGGVRLGSPFAGEYLGTFTSSTQSGYGIVYIDVNGALQLSVPDLIPSFAEGNVDASGVFIGLNPYSCSQPSLITRFNTPVGQPLLLTGGELTGMIVDSTFRVTIGIPLVGTANWTVRLNR